jgi:outer membrane lipoprotein-sorting protein
MHAGVAMRPAPASGDGSARRKRLALLALAALLHGCAPRAPPPDLSLDPAELLAQVRAAQARVQAVRGEVRVKVEAEDGTGTVTALVAAEKPDRLYVQTLDFFGNTAAVLAASGGTLSLYDARERVLYRGPATPQNLARLVPLPLSPSDLVDILCGSAPLAGEPVRAEPGRGHVTLELAAGARTQVLRVGSSAAVERSSVRVAGAPGAALDLEFTSSEAALDARFPADVSLAAEEPRVRMSLAWVEAERNPALDAALFSPGIPRGARVVELDEVRPQSPFTGALRE